MAVPAQHDEFSFLTARRALRLPLPPAMRNHGNVIVSLSQLTAWLAEQAEAAGIDIFPGFAAAAPLYGADGAVTGVRVGDMGLTKDGAEGPNYTPGVEILAGTTILAEGCRGSTAKQLIQRFKLDAGKSPPTFGLGFNADRNLAHVLCAIQRAEINNPLHENPARPNCATAALSPGCCSIPAAKSCHSV